MSATAVATRAFPEGESQSKVKQDTFYSTLLSDTLDRQVDSVVRPFLSMTLQNLVQTADIILSGDLKQLDALVGDGACETRAIMVSDLVGMPTLRREAERVRVCAQRLWDSLQKKTLSIRDVLKEMRSESPDEKVSAAVSEGFTFLSRAHLLTITKSPKKERGEIATTITGAEAEVTSAKKLKAHFKESGMDGGHLDYVVECLQYEVSYTSIRYAQRAVKEIDSKALPEASYKTLQEMLAEGRRDYQMFHSIKSIFLRLRQQQKAVLLRETTFTAEAAAEKEAKEKALPTVRILYRPSTVGGDFERVQQSAYAALASLPTIVLEVVPLRNVTMEMVAQRIEEYGGLQEVMLMNMAAVTYADGIMDASGRAEVREYQEKARKVGFVATFGKTKRGVDVVTEVTNPCILIDHMYCNTLKNEVDIGVTP